MSSLFMQDESEGLPIDQRRVRQLFSFPQRTAESLFLRREVADRMQERLSIIKINPQHVLDAGCGEGHDLSVLQKKFPVSHVMGVDASYPMLAEAARHVEAQRGLLRRWTGAGKRYDAQWVCADFSHLPFAAGSMDMIWSNLALHWHARPDDVFKEWLRVLRQDGLLLFSCFGPNTLLELKEAFNAVDQFDHVMPFIDMHDWGDMLVSSGFTSPVLDREVITVTYSSLDRLFSDVRALGGNALIQRRRGLLGKQAYKKMAERLESGKNAENLFSLQFEIIYGHAFHAESTIRSSQDEAVMRFVPRS